MMANWVCTKNVNLENINKKINECFKTNHFTNNGKNVIETQQLIKNIFKINDSKEVLLVCNGAMGLNALVGGYNMLLNKKLKCIVQSFTFPCSVQGCLKDSIVVDIDEHNLGPNINKLEEFVNSYDIIVVTNCFGTSCNIKLYEEFAKKHNKILLFDNAASSFTYYNGQNHLNYGNGTMVSLHHTKPIGFGEGGFIVFDKEMKEIMEKTICFGFTSTNRHNFSVYANNYKMSEISCIYISEYLNNVQLIYQHHTSMIDLFIQLLEKNNLLTKVCLYKNFSHYNKSLMATIPILFNESVNIEKFKSNGIDAKKYYFPLNDDIISNDLFNRIICLPLNLDVTSETIDLYICIIKLYI